MKINSKQKVSDIDLEVLRDIFLEYKSIALTDDQAAKALGMSLASFKKLKDSEEYRPKKIPGLQITRNTYETLSILWKAAQTAKYE